MSVNVEAPVGGWNARDALDNMKPADAVELVNWIPDSGYCRLRRGSKVYASGLGGEVKTLAEYHFGATRKFFAAANGSLWDITDPLNVTSFVDVFTSDKFQTEQHADKLIFVNGAEVPREFDGTSLNTLTLTGITTPANIVGCRSFKGRMFYWEKDSQDFYYCAAGAYTGALTLFPLGKQLQKGGNLVSMMTWTRDSGLGMDDMAVFIFSTGETIVYQGDDPADANNWSMVGRFNIGEPVDIRGHARYSSDEVLITKDGYVNMSGALITGRVSTAKNFSDKINAAAKGVTQSYDQNEGWQAILYPKGSLFIINVPISSTQFEQHVRNTNTGAWTKFIGWNARCFGLYDDNLYFGGDGEVYQADTGYSDSGALIRGEAVTAFNYCGSNSRKKLLTAVEIVSNYLFPQYAGLSASADFRKPEDVTTFTPSEGSPSEWETAPWDPSPWANSSGRIIGGWRSVCAHGYAIALRVIIQSGQQAVKWYATKLKVQYTGEI